MEVTDIQKLFAHIRNLLPNCKSVPKLTTGMARALCKAFDGYSYEQVESAATSHAMEKRFWPDTAELIARLPQSQGKSNAEWLHRWADARRAELKAAGVMTAVEAKENGMTWDEWNVQAEEAGL